MPQIGIGVRTTPTRWFRNLLLVIATVGLTLTCRTVVAQQIPVDGVWAVGNENACSTNPYQLQTSTAVWKFTDRKGGTNVERVIQSGNNVFITETISSPDQRPGTRWEYRFQGPSRAEVRNVTAQRGFVIVRCFAPPTAPPPTVSANADAPATACDISAASPYDSQRKGPGVSYDAVNATTAIPQCADAASRYPNSGRIFFQLGRALEKGGRIADAISAYNHAAENGHGGGFNNIGEMYRDGKGFARDLAKAEQYFKNGTTLGYAEAQFNLANLLLKNSRDGATIAQARQLLIAASSGGYLDAQKVLQTLPPPSPPVGVQQFATSPSSVTPIQSGGANLTADSPPSTASVPPNPTTQSTSAGNVDPVRREESERSPRLVDLTRRFGDEMATVIIAREIRKGMTKEQVIEAIGNPATRDKVPPDTELWRYSEQRIVFTDDRVSYIGH